MIDSILEEPSKTVLWLAGSQLLDVSSNATRGVCPDYVHKVVYDEAKQGWTKCVHADEITDYDCPYMPATWDKIKNPPFYAMWHPNVGTQLAYLILSEHDKLHNDPEYKADPAIYAIALTLYYSDEVMS